MKITDLAAFACYALAALLSILFGVIYLVRSQFMPYYRLTPGKPWHALDLQLQALLLGLMRSAGGSLLAAGISSLVL